MAAENRRADVLGMRRYETMYEVDDAVKIGQLVPITGVKINDKLPKDRRYLRPEVLSFLERLNRDVGSNLTVDSAIRPADVQRRLGRFNPNAAPFDGYRAQVATNEVPRLISADEASRYGITDSWWQDFSIIGQSGESLLSKSEDACTSSSETGENT